jgi:multiple sugar transport system permease protein
VRRVVTGVADHVLLVAVSLAFLAPVVVALATALMTDDQALSPRLWPDPFRWGNFAEVFDRVPLARYATNSVIVAGVAAIGVVVSSVPVAYALSCLEWRGREAVFVLVLASSMLPIHVLVVPQYALFSELGWVGTFRPLIVPAFFGDAFAIFLLRQFFLLIPRSLLDAARADGAGELSVLLRVVVPLARPAIATAALLSILFTWSDLFGPLLYLRSERELWTLPLALTELRTLHSVEWNLTMAACLLFALPVVALFVAAQRVVLDGIRLADTR